MNQPSPDEWAVLESTLLEAAFMLNVALRAVALAGREVCVDLSEAPAPTRCAQIRLTFPKPQ